MTAETILTRARIVLPDEVIEGSVVVRGGRIVAIDPGGTAVPCALDLEGNLLLPGLVELHTDNFERHLLPRPRVGWPPLAALVQHDAEVAAAGITTVYDALCIGESDFCGLRGLGVVEVRDALEHAVNAGVLRAEHKIHVRCELPAPNAPGLFRPFMDHRLLGLISLMDHTPGQRQWSNIENARGHYTARNGWSDETFEVQLARAPNLQRRHALEHRRFFVEYAIERGIPLASHDDALASHVAEAHRDGVGIAEFPTTLEAARHARALGLHVVMGAPNVVRGGSHSGNVSAISLARQRLLDVLSSDYVPASLLMAAFQLTRDAGYSTPEAVATVSRTPARALGLDDRGEIALGKRADLVQVQLAANGAGAHPIVRAVWRRGERVS